MRGGRWRRSRHLRHCAGRSVIGGAAGGSATPLQVRLQSITRGPPHTTEYKESCPVKRKRTFRVVPARRSGSTKAFREPGRTRSRGGQGRGSSGAASAGRRAHARSTSTGPIFAPAADTPRHVTGGRCPSPGQRVQLDRWRTSGAGVDDVHVDDRVAVEPYSQRRALTTPSACAPKLRRRSSALGRVGRRRLGGGFSQFGGCGASAGSTSGAEHPRHRRRRAGWQPSSCSAYHAVRLSGDQPNRSAVVFGAGPIGRRDDCRAARGAAGRGSHRGRVGRSRRKQKRTNRRSRLRDRRQRASDVVW